MCFISLYTGAVTFPPPLCDHKRVRSPLKAERRPNVCLGRSRVVHSTFRHRHGRHGRREVLSMFKQSQKGRRGDRSPTGGMRKAHTSSCSQNGCTVVGHWSPSKKCEMLWTLCINLSDASAFLVPPLCLLWPTIERSLWRPRCLHSATKATLERHWQWFCLHFASFARPVVPHRELWSFKRGTRVVLKQLHRNRTFWVWATTERPSHFSGRSKVTQRSQPCVKGLKSYLKVIKITTVKHPLMTR